LNSFITGQRGERRQRQSRSRSKKGIRSQRIDTTRK
jgi:hypothetical protein